MLELEGKKKKKSDDFQSQIVKTTVYNVRMK